MPFYEYECSACKFYVEALQKISDPPLKKCPSCKKSTLKKLVSAPAFRLAGGGWYETDFKSDNENKRNLVGEEKESTESKEDKSESKSDAKSEAKADTKASAETKADKQPAKSAASKKSTVKSTVRAKPKAPAKKK